MSKQRKSKIAEGEKFDHSIARFVKEFYPEYYSWNKYPAPECAAFKKAKDEWGLLCNFGNTPVEVNGVTFKNVEQLYQLMKFKDKEKLFEIYAKNGLPIKWAAKSGEKEHLRREDWGEMLVDAMKFCLQKKYDQNKAFRQKLEASKGLFIVEVDARSKPTTWSTTLHDGIYEGPNLMGRLLMELRDNGKLEYKLPADALDFIETIKQEKG